MTYRWAGTMIAAVTIPLTLTANVLVEALTNLHVPVLANLVAVATAGVAATTALVARTQERSIALVEQALARLDRLEECVGDYNAGFAAGYLLSVDRDPATVVPLVPRSRFHRAVADRRR